MLENERYSQDIKTVKITLNLLQFLALIFRLLIYSPILFLSMGQYYKGELDSEFHEMRWAGHVARMGEERGVYRALLGKPEGKRPLGET